MLVARNTYHRESFCLGDTLRDKLSDHYLVSYLRRLLLGSLDQLQTLLLNLLASHVDDVSALPKQGTSDGESVLLQLHLQAMVYSSVTDSSVHHCQPLSRG